MAWGSHGGCAAGASTESRESNAPGPCVALLSLSSWGWEETGLSLEPTGISQQPQPSFSARAVPRLCVWGPTGPPPARWSLGELHRAHLPYSFEAHLWPMWSLSAPVTRKGGDWGAPGASALSSNTQQHHMLCRKTRMSWPPVSPWCPSLWTRPERPRNPTQRHQVWKYREQIIYLPDLRWSLARVCSQFWSSLSALLASSMAFRLSWACLLLLSSASSFQLHQRNTTTKKRSLIRFMPAQQLLMP